MMSIGGMYPPFLYSWIGKTYRRLEAFEMSYYILYMRILKTKWEDTITNEEVIDWLREKRTRGRMWKKHEPRR